MVGTFRRLDRHQVTPERLLSQSMLPGAATHSHLWPVTAAMLYTRP
jgi:hypothetical protein